MSAFPCFPKYIVLLALFCSSWNARTQTLAWPDFRRQVLEQHPAARQADLFRDRAAFQLLRAKGGFDPKIFSDFYTKYYGGKTYFRYTEAGVGLPTWAGLELKGTYNLASGAYLNPEATLPTQGQAALGLNWTLGQGLLIDERRADLQQARIGIAGNEAERAMLLNDLIFDAASAYWNWVAAGNQVAIYESALRQSQIRHEALRESFLQGDKPAIDTVETFIQVQNRLLDVNFAQVDLQNAQLALQNFLWTPDNQPVRAESIAPPPAFPDSQMATFTPIDRNAVLQEAETNHPALRYYQNKLQSLEVERRLKNEKRKPVLDVYYNLLGSGWEFFPTSNTDGLGVLANDIKWGLNFSYPLLNRKARGDLQLTQVKIAQTDLDLEQKRQSVRAKVQQYANELENLRNQIALFRSITANYRSLLDAELEKFNLGESSIFLINTREQRWLEAQVKYLKLLASYQKAEAGLLWAKGAF